MSRGTQSPVGSGTASDLTSRQVRGTHRFRRLAVTCIVATPVAMVATTGVAALARVVGVDFEVQDGETIPLAGIAVLTGFFSLVGVGIAAALLLGSARPAERFVQTAVTLTAISLVAPFFSGGSAATIAALLGLHIVAAAVMVPSVARSVRTPTDP
jgi:hypothetical protein